MDFDDLLHKSSMLVPGKFVSKDFLSQKADKIYFVFKKHYLCKFDPLLVWKELQVNAFNKQTNFFWFNVEFV